MIATEKPKTAAEIAARISEIGVELAAYRMGYHPRWRQLTKEQDQLRASYDAALKAGGVDHT